MFRENREVARTLLYEYRVVHVPAGDTQVNAGLAKQYGADLARGYPYLTVLDASGKAVANQETGALEDGDHHDPAKVLAFLKQHQAAPQDANEVLAAASARAKASGKRVLLAFEAPW